jgi:predicted RNase H-related nuclease YkuK (DUF458 family)
MTAGIEEIPSDIFQIMGTHKRVFLFNYIDTLLSADPSSELHIGCDSQNFRQHTVYVTAVVLRFPGNGAHVLYQKERVPIIRDLWTKLWGETERSVNLAESIKEKVGIRAHQIDLDYNTDPAYPSNKLLNASTGYITSLGYESKAKPNLLMAVWAANYLCH